MKVTRYFPRRRPDIEVVLFDADLGWEHALEVAKWCGGKAHRDEYKGQQDKTYYWSIRVPGRHIGWIGIRAGDYIARDDEGFVVLGREDLENDYIELENA